MLTLLVSLLLGVATFLGVFTFLSLIEAILPAIVVLIVAFFWISRRIAKKMEAHKEKLASGVEEKSKKMQNSLKS